MASNNDDSTPPAAPPTEFTPATAPGPIKAVPTPLPTAYASGMKAFADYLEQRQLRPYASRLQLEYLSHQQVDAFLGYPANSDAIKIPYFDLSGAPIMDGGEPYARLRLLHPPKNAGKYRQKAGTAPHAYFPPRFDATQPTWLDVAADPTVEIVITEGELNSVRAALTPGFPPTIGIGGVDSFTGGRSGTPVVLELQGGWQWKKRLVNVTFDADHGTEGYKPAVQAAIDRFAATFEGMNAVVMATHLGRAATGFPAIPAAGKIALDTYALAGGTWDILKLTAEPVTAFDDLRKLLARFGLLPNDHVVEFESGRIWPPHVFARFEAAPFQVPTEKGPKPAADFFFRSEKRTRVHTIGIFPTHPVGLVKIPRVEADGGTSADNGWSDQDCVLVVNKLIEPPGWWRTHPPSAEERAAQTATVAVWTRCIEEFFSGELGFARLFHDWVCQAVRFPNSRNYTSWVLCSPEQGVGKSLIAETLARMVGAQLGLIGSPGLFYETYNAHLQGKIFVVMNEVEDTRGFARTFKHYRTADVLDYNEKFVPRFRNRNYANFLITTNEPLAYLTDEDARRDIIYRPHKTAHDPQWQHFLRSEVVPISINATPLRHLLEWYRHDYELKDYRPTNYAPPSAARSAAAEHGYSEAEADARSLIEWLREEGIQQPLFESQALRAVFNDKTEVVTKKLHHLAPQGKWAKAVFRNDGQTLTRIYAMGMTNAELEDLSRPERLERIAATHQAMLKWLQGR
jgi:Family of unknown function (DUF5906)